MYGYGIIVALLCCAPFAEVSAQDTPEARALVSEWMREQRTRWEPVTRFRIEEHVLWSADSPFGARKIEFEAEVNGTPGSRRLDRDIKDAWLNGRRVRPQELQRFEEQRRNLVRGSEEEIRTVAEFVPRFMAAVRPNGPVSSEVVDGVTYRRVELLPRDERLAIERMTLWFHPDGERLFRARAVISGRRGTSSFVVVNTYSRINGLDIPVHRSVEGTVQTKRRMRVFTTLLSYEAHYDNIRLFDR